MIPVTDIPDDALFAMIAAMKEAQETLADLTRPAPKAGASGAEVRNLWARAITAELHLRMALDKLENPS